MDKDKRIKTVKILIGTGDITEFGQVFDHIPKTTVAKNLGYHFTRMAKMVEDVNEIRAKDIFLLSSYFEIDAKVLFDLIYNQHHKKTNGKSRKGG